MKKVMLICFTSVILFACSEDNDNKTKSLNTESSKQENPLSSQESAATSKVENKVKEVPVIKNRTIYSFDEIQPGLDLEKTAISDEITVWIRKSININTIDEHPETILTKRCNDYLNAMPDDIELGLEENPEAYKKQFEKKWGKYFDMNRIPGGYPFGYCGNGGPCEAIYLNSVNYIGSDPDGYYYKIIVGGNKNAVQNNKLIIRVIFQNDEYMIDNVMTDEKVDFFSF